MYVKEIRLQNFQSYYGPDNALVFSEGLNVVVGSINKGKSKLFDAFYWVLFGDIFITGGNWINTNNLPARSSFINDRARFLAQPGEVVEVAVELVLCRREGDDDSGPLVEYTFCRTVVATRRTDTTADWHDERAWHVGNSCPDMRYRSGQNLKIIDNELEVEQEIKKLFPREIRNYVWFQGEALDKLIDFENRLTFEQAIRHISYYPRYTILSQLIDEASGIIEKERNKQVKESTADKKQFDDRERDLKQARYDLRQLENELVVLEKRRDDARELKEESEKKLNALHEFPPLEKELNQAENKLEKAKDQINTAIDQQKDKFQKTWLLKGISGVVAGAKQRMLDYEDQRSSNAKYVLPTDVPPKVFMEKMLAAEQCLVCGTDAPAGSAPHSHIQQRITAQESHYQQIKDNQELYSTVQQLLVFPDEVIGMVSGIDAQIANTEDQIEEAIRNRNQANDAVQDTKARINSLIGKYHVSLSDGSRQSQLYLNKLTTASDTYLVANGQIDKKERAIEQKKTAISQLEEKLNNTGSTSGKDIPEKRWYELATYLKGIVKRVENHAKVDMIGKIEDRANHYYGGITKHNRAVDGKISIDRVSYKISRTENDEYTVASGNMGNFTLMKMCIINAMLNLNEEEAGEAYPFIADAPTSNLDYETTIAYLKSLAPSFGQSIIITKDISPFQIPDVSRDSSVQTIHQLETYSENPNAEKLTQYEAYTKIKRIK